MKQRVSVDAEDCIVKWHNAELDRFEKVFTCEFNVIIHHESKVRIWFTLCLFLGSLVDFVHLFVFVFILLLFLGFQLVKIKDKKVLAEIVAVEIRRVHFELYY
jgi:hypothetical protein